MNRLTNGNNKKRYSNNRRTQPRLVKANAMRARYVSNHSSGFFAPKMTIKKNKAIVILLISLMILFAMKNHYISAFFTDFKQVINVFSINAQYTVSFKPNSGIGSMEDQVISYNVDTALNTNTFTRVGYILTGWNTKSDGSGTSYENGEKVRNIGKTTLYAQWKKLLTKYAVQIYGINEDEDVLGNKLGLTFGPATYGNYNNSYVTHTYEETAPGSEQYYVKIVTHTVAPDSSETITTQYLKDSSNNNVVRTAAEKNKYDINMHKMTWDEIAAVQDKTSFLDCMLCGDTKPIELSLNSVLGNGENFHQYGDGSGLIYNSIDHYYTLWNPNSSQNAAATAGGINSSNARLAGGYSSSHIRATLIGENAKTNIEHAGDVNLKSNTCLYSCVGNDLKNVIVAKKLKYVTGTGAENYTINDDLADDIWLFSDREVYGLGQFSGQTSEGIGTDGVGYSKYGNTESKFYIPTYNINGTDKRKVYDENEEILHWWLRSITLTNDYHVRYVRSGGGLLNDNAYGYGKSGGLSFGFCIDTVPVNYTIRYDSNTGTGTMADQTLKSNETQKLRANSFKKRGYAFKEWNTEPNGTGTAYTDEELVRGLSSTEGTVVTLYAQWEESYEVKYAVQIYGINQDEDENGNPLGLTFGPATEIDYTNTFITHSYEETSSGSNMYYVVRNIHTVAANGTETVNTAYLYENGGNSEKVIRSAAEKTKYDVNIHNMTWTEIANTTDKTKFLDCMLCGDTKSVTFTLNDTIASGNTFDQYGDGTGMLLDSIAPYYRMWNPSNTSTQYPERNNAAAIHGDTEGSNAKNAGGYSTSHIRATLIGTNSKTDAEYAGNENLNESNSLYSCIENELKNVIRAKRIKYVTGTDDVNYTINNDIVDKIWLFSPREEFGDGSTSGNTGEGIGTEGSGYDKFKNNESRYYAALYSNDDAIGRANFKEDGQRNAWWLRAPSLHYDSHPIIVHKYSHITCSPAFETEECGIAIGFCLQGEYNITFNANGGTGTMTNQKISNNVPTNLKPNSFVSEDYIFKGWNTAADGSGTSYTDGEQVNNLGNITLYAQWKKINKVKYAVQIYGINQDVDADGNPLGLTFGPATELSYRNSYITHSYEETSAGSNEYYVVRILHEIAANGTETTHQEYLYKNGGNSEKVVRTAAEKEKYDINIHDMPWVEIANTTDKSKFLDCMLCGDTKSVTFNLNDTIASGVTFDQYGDGTGMLHETINPYYRMWNPSYGSTTYPDRNNSAAVNSGLEGTNAKNAGSYSSSHIRATLVGKDSKTNESYAGDVNLNASNSLYSCMQSDLREIVAAKKVKYVTGTSNSNYTGNDDIVDKIWLFSRRELYGVESFGGEDPGVGYDKFGNNESGYYIQTYTDGQSKYRKNYKEDDENYTWFVRCPNLSKDDYVYLAVDGLGTGFFENEPSSCTNHGSIAVGFCLQGEYTVLYNRNGGSGVMTQQTITNNVATNLKANSFTKENYNFVGWNTKADGTGTSYADGESVTNLGSVILYAQWEEIPPYQAKYAVQIYGINQDEDANGDTLGLTFGPATGADYNNAYVTHEYEEIPENPGNYYVKIVTHTVAANGTETTTEEYLTNKDGNNVIRTQAQKTARENISLHEMTWAQIAAVSDKTVFEDCMLCGDTKSVALALNNTIRTSNEYEQYGDGAGMLINTIGLYYRRWNPSLGNNSAVGTGVTLTTNEINAGSNAKEAGGYRVSHIRATLIGKENSNPTIGYAGDVNLSADKCLYSCIESDLQNVITPKKIKYVTGSATNNYALNDDISDKIWMFSDREVYGTGTYSGQTTEGIGATGVGYARFSNTESKYYLSGYGAGTSLSKGCYGEDGVSGTWWLRSPSLSGTTGIRRIDSAGALNSSNAYYSGYGLTFGFCIR